MFDQTHIVKLLPGVHLDRSNFGCGEEPPSTVSSTRPYVIHFELNTRAMKASAFEETIDFTFHECIFRSRCPDCLRSFRKGHHRVRHQEGELHFQQEGVQGQAREDLGADARVPGGPGERTRDAGDEGGRTSRKLRLFDEEFRCEADCQGGGDGFCDESQGDPLRCQLCGDSARLSAEMPADLVIKRAGCRWNRNKNAILGSSFGDSTGT
eukprot:s179_g9.t1